jgi:hypothetical protein
MSALFELLARLKLPKTPIIYNSCSTLSFVIKQRQGFMRRKFEEMKQKLNYFQITTMKFETKIAFKFEFQRTKSPTLCAASGSPGTGPCFSILPSSRFSGLP